MPSTCECQRLRQLSGQSSDSSAKTAEPSHVNVKGLGSSQDRAVIALQRLLNLLMRSSRPDLFGNKHRQGRCHAEHRSGLENGSCDIMLLVG